MLGKFTKRGFTLIELVLVVGLGSMIAVNEVDQERLKAEQQRTRVMAGEIAVFQKALNSYISYHRGSVTATSTPAELSGVKRGINWLKRRSDCDVGTSTFPSEFLPCDFLKYNDGKLGFSNLEFTTYFDTEYDTGSGIGRVVTKTVLSDRRSGIDTPWIRNDDVAKGLSGLAAVLVNGDSVLLSSTSTVSSRATFCLETTGEYCSDPAFPTGDHAKNKIVLLNATAAESGIHLRTDGSNSMRGAIGFHESVRDDLREIRNIARLFGNEDRGIVLGQSNFMPASFLPNENMVVVDSDQMVFGELSVKRDAVMDQALTVMGLATFESGIISNSNVLINGDLSAENIFARRINDRDNSAFFIDPDKLSVMNNLEIRDSFKASQYVDADDDQYLIDPNGSSRISQIEVDGRITADELVDRNNASLKIDLDGTSVMDRLELNGISAFGSEALDIQGRNGVSIESRNGSIGIDGQRIEVTGTRGLKIGQDEDYEDADFTLVGSGTTLRAKAKSNIYLDSYRTYLDSDYSRIMVNAGGVYRSLRSLVQSGSESTHRYNTIGNVGRFYYNSNGDYSWESGTNLPGSRLAKSFSSTSENGRCNRGHPSFQSANVTGRWKILDRVSGRYEETATRVHRRGTRYSCRYVTNSFLAVKYSN